MIFETMARGTTALDILYLQNEIRRHCATRLDRMLGRRGARVRHCWAAQNDFPQTLDTFDALVIGGGPAGPYEDREFIRREHDLARAFAASGRPMLGICFGSQLLASALCGGDQVFRRRTPETGVLPIALCAEAASDPLLSGFASPLAMLVWHSDEIRTGHRDIALLGSTADCPNHIWRYRDAPIWGIQGHPEVSGGRANAWLDENADRLAADNADAQMLRAPASQLFEAPRLIDRFLDILHQ